MAKSSARKNRTVAVTGAAGYVAGKLIRALLADDSIDRVLGFDVRRPDIVDAKFVFDELDVRNPALEARLAGVDCVVHLAFIMDPIKDESLMRDVNVNGSQNVFRCAGKAGVKKIIYTSSAVAYGAHPDNDFPLTEGSPLRANLDFSYAAHKLEVEYVVKEFRDDFPKVTLTVFRPVIVLGPNVDNAWSRTMQTALLLGVRGYNPSYQFVHEEDVAAALAFAVDNDLDGPYNLAPEDWIATDEIVQILNKKRLTLSEPAAFALVDRMWSAGLSDGPGGMLHYVMHPWVVSSKKLEEAGFRCSHSTVEVFVEAAENLRHGIRIGTTTVRRGDLVKGAAAGAGLLGAALTMRRARRRRALSRV